MSDQGMRKVVRKVIELPPALKKQIACECACTDDTVRNALNFKTTGDNADRIRQRAIELKGVTTTRIIWVRA